MKNLALIVLVFISIKAFGQKNQKKSPDPDLKKFQVGVNLSPDICFRKLKNNNGRSSSADLIEELNKRETSKFGYTTGINICWNINRLADIEGGIQYSNKGYQTRFMDEDPLDPDPLTIGSDIRSKHIYSFHYIDIPVKANFKIGNKKIRFLASAGVTTNILIKETDTRVSKNFDGKTEREKEPTGIDYKRINISPAISIGVDYKINDRLSLRIEPTFKYGILKITQSPITANLWSGGLNTSCFFAL